MPSKEIIDACSEFSGGFLSEGIRGIVEVSTPDEKQSIDIVSRVPEHGNEP